MEGPQCHQNIKCVVCAPHEQRLRPLAACDPLGAHSVSCHLSELYNPKTL